MTDWPRVFGKADAEIAQDAKAEAKKQEWFCGFCHKSEHVARTLFQGKSALICAECVSLIVEAMLRQPAGKGGK